MGRGAHPSSHVHTNTNNIMTIIIIIIIIINIIVIVIVIVIVIIIIIVINNDINIMNMMIIISSSGRLLQCRTLDFWASVGRPICLSQQAICGCFQPECSARDETCRVHLGHSNSAYCFSHLGDISSPASPVSAPVCPPSPPLGYRTRALSRSHHPCLAALSAPASSLPSTRRGLPPLPRST